VTRKCLREFLPRSVQKSYFMLSDAGREVLKSAALRLMADYRLVLEEDPSAEFLNASSGMVFCDRTAPETSSVGLIGLFIFIAAR
jgi:hypothetical protein